MEKYIQQLVDDPEDQSAIDMIDLFKTSRQRQLDLEETAEWRIDNLEYDLRTSPLIIEKASRKSYAQNLYAALCNNEFIKNDVWPILTDKRWGCSWRYAGGIIADIRQEGDYIDWYCSGIRNSTEDLVEDPDKVLTPEQQAYRDEIALYVGESFVTDEIKQDLLTLGWIVAGPDQSLDY
jgi:hypothetical protein